MKAAFQFLLPFVREAGKTVLVFLFAVAVLGVVSAFQEPSAPPPGGTVYAPVNTGSAAQTKSGGLSILGNLGVGTQSPTAKLQIGSGTSIWTGGPHLDLVGSRPGDGSPVATLSFSPSPTKGWHQNADTAGTMSFYAFRSGAWFPALVLRENGNIGIGNTAGNARLHIRGDNTQASDYTLFTEYEGRALFEVKNDGNAGLGVANPDDYVSSPKGGGGYLNVKDVWLRDAGKWASQAAGGSAWFSGWFYHYNPGGQSWSPNYNLGSSGQFKFCSIAGTYGSPYNGCSVELSGSQWFLRMWAGRDNDAICRAVCF